MSNIRNTGKKMEICRIQIIWNELFLLYFKKSTQSICLGFKKIGYGLLMQSQFQLFGGGFLEDCVEKSKQHMLRLAG